MSGTDSYELPMRGTQDAEYPTYADLQADRNFWKLSFEAADMAVQEEREELKKAYAEIEELEHIRKDLLARNYKLEAESYVISEFNKMIEKTVDEVQKENERLRTIEKAAINLCKVRGRHHSEIAMNQLMKACGFKPAKDAE